MRLDYSELSQRLKQAPRPSDRERLDEELRSETEAKAAALAKLEPNMKAIDQYEGVVEKERQQLEDLEMARKRLKEAQDSFDDFKNRRTLTFNEAFDHISDAIDRVYKELTSSEAHPMGGTAYLSLESAEEPYNHGVKFTGDAADETVQGHGTALRRREDHGGAGTDLRDPLLPQFAVLRAGRGGRGAGQDQRGEDGGVYPKQVARHRRGVRGPGVPVHRHLAQGLLLRQGGLVGGVSRDINAACSRVLTST